MHELKTAKRLCQKTNNKFLEKKKKKGRLKIRKEDHFHLKVNILNFLSL